MGFVFLLLVFALLVGLALAGLGRGVVAIARDERPSGGMIVLIAMGIVATAIVVLILLAFSSLSNDTS